MKTKDTVVIKTTLKQGGRKLKYISMYFSKRKNFWAKMHLQLALAIFDLVLSFDLCVL